MGGLRFTAVVLRWLPCRGEGEKGGVYVYKQDGCYGKVVMHALW